MTLFELTKALINIESITGNETEHVDYLREHLTRKGFETHEQVVASGRHNLLASVGEPKVLLCTHTDTVPPFFEAREDDDYIYGRGACDTKGIIAAMLHAAAELHNDNVRDFGLLFVVGEEVDSIGAKTANALDVRPRFTIVGEPTENKLARGHKGIVAMRLTAHGKAAHSAFPHLGDSAIHKILDVLQKLRHADFGHDSVLGDATINIGAVTGGVAHNVIAQEASADVSIRCVTSTSEVLDIVEKCVNGEVKIEMLSVSEPQKLHTIQGFKETVVPFGTDIPHLKNFGKPLLIGPGSCLDAHTANERISKKALLEAVPLYKKLVTKLLSEQE